MTEGLAGLLDALRHARPWKTLVVLEDHKRQGTRLIPPLLTNQTPVTETYWIAERVPELFWIAYLLDRFEGVERPLRQFNERFKSIVQARSGSTRAFRALLASEHRLLTDEERRHLDSETRRAPWRQLIGGASSDLASLWPEFPLAYLQTPKRRRSKPVLVRDVRRILGNLQHRHQPLSLRVQRLLVAEEYRLGQVLRASGLKPVHLKSIDNFPRTKASQVAAGHVVTVCNMLVSQLSEVNKSPWPRQFWNGCYRLGPCEHG